MFEGAALKQRDACAHVAALPHLLANAPAGSHLRQQAHGMSTTLVLEGTATLAGEMHGVAVHNISGGLKLLDVTDTMYGTRRAFVWGWDDALPALVTRERAPSASGNEHTQVSFSPLAPLANMTLSECKKQRHVCGTDVACGRTIKVGLYQS